MTVTVPWLTEYLLWKSGFFDFKDGPVVLRCKPFRLTGFKVRNVHVCPACFTTGRRLCRDQSPLPGIGGREAPTEGGDASSPSTPAQVRIGAGLSWFRKNRPSCYSGVEARRLKEGREWGPVEPHPSASKRPRASEGRPPRGGMKTYGVAGQPRPWSEGALRRPVRSAAKARPSYRALER